MKSNNLENLTTDRENKHQKMNMSGGKPAHKFSVGTIKIPIMVSVSFQNQLQSDLFDRSFILLWAGPKENTALGSSINRE